ncbi:hypothetical protein ACOSQ2_020028 [Xanthoceras sorbifolium]
MDPLNNLLHSICFRWKLRRLPVVSLWKLNLETPTTSTDPSGRIMLLFLWSLFLEIRVLRQLYVTSFNKYRSHIIWTSFIIFMLVDCLDFCIDGHLYDHVRGVCFGWSLRRLPKVSLWKLNLDPPTRNIDPSMRIISLFLWNLIMEIKILRELGLMLTWTNPILLGNCMWKQYNRN